MRTNKGFTLIEILVVLGIIAILAAVVLIAINPARQFAQARDSQRLSNVNAILNAFGQNLTDNRVFFVCPAGDVPTTTALTMKSGEGGYNIRDCLVPLYLSEIPFDPKIGNNTCNANCSSGSYDTGYNIWQSTTTGRVTVTAPATEVATPTISITR